MSLGERTEQAGIVAEPGIGNFQPIQIGRVHDVLAHGLLDGIHDQVAAEGYTAAEDDDGWIEDVQEVGGGLTDEGAGAGKGFFRQCIAFVGSLGDAASGESGLAFEERFAAGGDLLADISHDGRSGSDRLQVTANTA